VCRASKSGRYWGVDLLPDRCCHAALARQYVDTPTWSPPAPERQQTSSTCPRRHKLSQAGSSPNRALASVPTLGLARVPLQGGWSRTLPFFAPFGRVLIVFASRGTSGRTSGRLGKAVPARGSACSGSRRLCTGSERSPAIVARRLHAGVGAMASSFTPPEAAGQPLRAPGRQARVQGNWSNPTCSWPLTFLMCFRVKVTSHRAPFKPVGLLPEGAAASSITCVRFDRQTHPA